MGLHGDEAGLLWHTPVRTRAQGRASEQGAPIERPPPQPSQYPPSSWVAPTSFPSLRGVSRICVDVESKDPNLKKLGPGYQRKDAHICGLGIGTDDGRRWYFPTAHEGGGNLDADLVQSWARSELNGFAGEVVGAKLIYDLEALATWQITMPLANFHDVQLAEPLLDEHRFEYNLDVLSRDYLGEGKDEELLYKVGKLFGYRKADEVKGNLYKYPAAFVGPYAEVDVDRPLRILPIQLAALEAEDLIDVYNTERKLLPILRAMRMRGVRVDIAKAEEVRAQLIKVREECLDELKRQAGPTAEFMAADSFTKALIDRGLPVQRTPKGAISVTRDWLKAQAGDPLVDALIRGRQVNTIINTFLDGHILGHHVNGRIHAEFPQLKGDDEGTIGRFSSQNPNLQNIPARDKVLAPLIRQMFLPDEGEEWERHDQSQMEFRLQTHWATGPGAKEARQRYVDDPKTDFHKMAAEIMHIDPEDEVERKRVKSINFAKGYGAQAPKLALMLGITVHEAEAFVGRYETALPFTIHTFNRAKGVAEQQGFIRSILKRRARFTLFEPRLNSRMPKAQRQPPLPEALARAAYGEQIVRAYTYTALNKLLQLSNADYTKKTMVDVWEQCGGTLGAFLLQVHDELDYSVPCTVEGNQAIRHAKHLMETAIELRVPVMVDAKRGANWGQTS